MAYLYIGGSIFFTVYGQMVLKWRMNLQAPLPDPLMEKVLFLIKAIIFDPFILSGFVAAFVASLFWMAAMTKFSISYAYPFMSLAFVFVMFGSAILLGESLNLTKIVGTLLIVSGLIVISRGY